MGWRSLRLEVDAQSAEVLADALLEAGALSVDIEDAAAGTSGERPVFAAIGGATPAWLRNRISALFERDVDVVSVLHRALDALALPRSLPYRIEEVEDQDWVRATQSQFQPIRISRRLWIVPSWRPPPAPRALNIVIDPGLAFGTGTHPSTQLCLRWLERQVRGGETLIDFGCGSGILAIAALKLGAAWACGVDIDEAARVAACRNAVQNRVATRFVAAADPVGDPAHLVVANILANPLIMMAPLIARATAERGQLALSGILLEQAQAVRAAYREWFDLNTMEQEDGWIMLGGTKRRRPLCRS